MAQTKRKRQTKHRGNAAGVVESRGRTGRKPTAEEKRGETKRAKQPPIDRRDRPPSWRAAFLRAMIAAVVLLMLGIVLLHGKSNTVIRYFPFALLLYTPISYYSDVWLYRRRQRKLAKQGGSR